MNMWIYFLNLIPMWMYNSLFWMIVDEISAIRVPRAVTRLTVYRAFRIWKHEIDIEVDPGRRQECRKQGAFEFQYVSLIPLMFSHGAKHSPLLWPSWRWLEMMVGLDWVWSGLLASLSSFALLLPRIVWVGFCWIDWVGLVGFFGCVGVGGLGWLSWIRLDGCWVCSKWLTGAQEQTTTRSSWHSSSGCLS